MLLELAQHPIVVQGKVNLNAFELKNGIMEAQTVVVFRTLT